MPTEASLISAAQVTAAMESADLAPVGANVALKLADYGNLLMRWNARTNLTAIRTPDGILKRHIVESVAAAQGLPASISTLLDYGSGAGLPGIPISLVRPDIRVTLAESQARKVAFLREASRTLGLAVTIHPNRVAALPSSTRFDCVTLRAVDNMEGALKDAVERLLPDGILAVFTTEASARGLIGALTDAGRLELPTPGFLLLLRP